MVTTKRSESFGNSFYSESAVGGVGLLDRKAPATYDEYVENNVSVQENLDETKARMKRNLDILLNYDKATEVAPVMVEERAEEIQEIKAEASLQEDDIRPTITTMQFGDVDIDQVRAEMRTEEKERKQYRLSAKGKMAIVLYALTVVVILALIVLNTGVLSSLNNQNLQSVAEIEEYKAQLSALNSDIETASSDQFVIDYATNELGMVKK